MLQKIQVPAFVKNFYFITGVLFIIWMIYPDQNAVVNQYQLVQKRNELLQEKEYYGEKISEVKKEREAVFNNPRELERFARENYLMKKPTEQVFIIQEN